MPSATHTATATARVQSVSFVVKDDRLEMVVEDKGAGIALPLLDQLLEADPSPRTVPMDGGMGSSRSSAPSSARLDVRGGDDGRGTVVHMTKFLYESVETS